jgi:hypothetical protein
MSEVASPDRTIEPTAPKIGFVSLGCPKALTDSELILTQLSALGGLPADARAGLCAGEGVAAAAPPSEQAPGWPNRTGTAGHSG